VRNQSQFARLKPKAGTSAQGELKEALETSADQWQ